MASCGCIFPSRWRSDLMIPEHLRHPDHSLQAASPGMRGGWRRRMLLFMALVDVIMMIVASGFWLVTSRSGLRWMGSTVSQGSAGKLSFEGLEGELGRSMRAHMVRFHSDDLIIIVRDMQLDWEPDALASRQLRINLLSAKDVEVLSLPSDEPASLPGNLEL